MTARSMPGRGAFKMNGTLRVVPMLLIVQGTPSFSAEFGVHGLSE